jgi:hypothetical protein
LAPAPRTDAPAPAHKGFHKGQQAQQNIEPNKGKVLGLDECIGSWCWRQIQRRWPKKRHKKGNDFINKLRFCEVVHVHGFLLFGVIVWKFNLFDSS